MKIFIFGAGASKGSQEGYSPNVLAPLVDEIFNETYQDFANQVGVEKGEIEGFRNDFILSGKGLEEWLTDLWERYTKSAAEITQRRYQAIFGRTTFYIWWLMQKVSQTYNHQNGYKLFLDKLSEEGEDYGFINFNYDTLLDRALVDTGYNLGGTLTSYADAKYFKPHGSVNWFLKKRPEDQTISGEEIYDNLARYRLAANAMYSGSQIPFNLTVLEPSHHDLTRPDIIHSGNFGNQYAFPFILIPLASKLYDRIETYKENIVDRATELVSGAKDIYLIGYRANDDLIKDIFASVNNAKLHVVGHEHAQDIQKEVLSWATTLKVGKIYNNGFTDFINTYGDNQ